MDGIAFQETKTVAWKTIEEYFGSVISFQAVEGGVTDATGNFIAALDSRSVTGGEITVPPGRFAISRKLTIPANVVMRGAGRGATTLVWIGIDGQQMISLPNDQSGVEDMTIDTGTATGMTGVIFKNNLRSWLTRVRILSATTASGVGLRLQGATSNCAYHDFFDVEIYKFQIGLQLDGLPTGPIVATDCTFWKLRLNLCALGIRAAQWCDTFDYFHAQFILGENGAIGAVFNDSATPTVDTGVYNHNFYGTAIDAFGGISGCTGFYFNASKQNQFYGFLHSPIVFPGTLINDHLGNAISYEIHNNQISAANNSIQILTKGVYRGSVQQSDASGNSYGLGPTDVTFDTDTYDTYGCFTSPTFTAPNTALYSVSLTLTHTAGVTVDDTWIIKLFATSRTYSTIYRVPSLNILSFNWTVSSVDMDAGDTLKVTIERSTGLGNFPLFADKDFNKLTIEQVSDGK